MKRLDAQILNKKLNEKFNDVYDAVKLMVKDENVCLDKLKGYSFGERRMSQKHNALYIGCEKFSYHDSSLLSMSGLFSKILTR